MNLALFDFDGTVTVKDTFTAFLRFAIDRRRMLVGGVLASPVGIGFRCGVIPAAVARPVYARCAFQGTPAARVRKLGRRYATDVLPGAMRPRALERIAWHQDRGDVVVIVSASLDVYLQPWGRSLGVAVICTELEERGGRMTGRYMAGDCSGGEKARRVQERYDLAAYATIYAYGDTAEDREMLALADRKYFRWTEVTSR